MVLKCGSLFHSFSCSCLRILSCSLPFSKWKNFMYEKNDNSKSKQRTFLILGAGWFKSTHCCMLCAKFGLAWSSVTLGICSLPHYIYKIWFSPKTPIPYFHARKRQNHRQDLTPWNKIPTNSIHSLSFDFSIEYSVVKLLLPSLPSALHEV